MAVAARQMPFACAADQHCYRQREVMPFSVLRSVKVPQQNLVIGGIELMIFTELRPYFAARGRGLPFS